MIKQVHSPHQINWNRAHRTYLSQFYVSVHAHVVFRISYACLAVMCILMTACSPDDTPAPTGANNLQDYTPFHLGAERIYQVDSMTYDPQPGGIVVDTHTSFLKEWIQDTQLLSGEKVYRIARFVRRDSAQAWQPLDVISEWHSPSGFIRNERNLTFVKLPFFPSENAYWNGHLFLDTRQSITIKGERIEAFKNWEFQIVQIDAPFKTDYHVYDSTLTTHAGSENLLEMRRQTEVYSKHQGLVFRELWILDTQTINAEIPWKQKAEKGYILRLQRI